MTDTVRPVRKGRGEAEPVGDAVAPESAAIPDAGRHPLDPELARSTRATAVLVLGVAAVMTAPLVGGIIPAIVALVLARQTYGDLVRARGYLIGAGRLRLGVTLAWVGTALAVAALVAAGVVGIIGLVNGVGQDFPPTSD